MPIVARIRWYRDGVVLADSIVVGCFLPIAAREPSGSVNHSPTALDALSIRFYVSTFYVSTCRASFPTYEPRDYCVGAREPPLFSFKSINTGLNQLNQDRILFPSRTSEHHCALSLRKTCPDAITVTKRVTFECVEAPSAKRSITIRRGESIFSANNRSVSRETRFNVIRHRCLSIRRKSSCQVGNVYTFPRVLRPAFLRPFVSLFPPPLPLSPFLLASIIVA